MDGHGPQADDLQRLLDRDEDAWRALHEREFPFLYRFAVGMGADSYLAEDCASEAVARLVRALPRLRADRDSSVRAWLVVTCRNYLHDQLRRRRSEPAPIDAIDAASADTDPTTRIALSSALAALPEAQREVITLRFVAGLPTRQVAAVIGRGEGAVESLQHRALEALRRSIHLEGNA